MQKHPANRSLRSLRLWVLAWFVLAVGMATVSPVLRPQALEIICTSGGASRLMVHTEGALVAHHTAGLECPLCLPAAAPGASPMALPLGIALPATRTRATTRTHPQGRSGCPLASGPHFQLSPTPRGKHEREKPTARFPPPAWCRRSFINTAALGV